MRFEAAIQTVKLLNEHHQGVAGKSVLELGTGRFVDLPMALWLMGADKVVTTDITTLLRADLVNKSIAFLRERWDEYRARFAPHCDEALMDQRYDEMCRASAGGFGDADLTRVLEVMGIDYRSPADATRMPMPDEIFDVYVSFVVLQHVPPEPMLAILKEARRLLKKDGRMVHFSNTSDHFSHVDSSLSPINFLRWSEREWQLIAGNRFMYQNRLRADDYYDIFRNAGMLVDYTEERVDERALSDLRAGFPLHSDWRKGTPERNAVIRYSAVLKRDDA